MIEYNTDENPTESHLMSLTNSSPHLFNFKLLQAPISMCYMKDMDIQSHRCMPSASSLVPSHHHSLVQWLTKLVGKELLSSTA